MIGIILLTVMYLTNLKLGLRFSFRLSGMHQRPEAGVVLVVNMACHHIHIPPTR
jgi:hypothetical protein